MPLLKVCLNEDQWRKLDQLHAELFRDYKLRRDMLLTRLDVTVLSFTVCTAYILLALLKLIIVFTAFTVVSQCQDEIGSSFCDFATVESRDAFATKRFDKSFAFG